MLPELPPEVWESIFEHAASVPGMLGPNTDSAYDSLYTPYSKAYKARLYYALRTKHAIVCVCKQWWHLAIPILYRSVYIGRARTLFSLCSTIARSAARSGSLIGVRPLGEYIQQLDIALLRRDQHPCIGISSLPALIRRMPHLAIVSIAISPGYIVKSDFADTVLDALRHSAASLRVLDWPSIYEPSASNILNFLDECTQLRILNCPRLVWCKELEHGGIPPTVTTLHLRTLIPPVQVPHFDPTTRCKSGPSALQELIIYPDCNIHQWRDVLHVYSSQLASVRFYVPGYQSSHFGDYLRVLAEECPRLRRLSIICTELPSLRPRRGFPSITYLGLRYYLPHLPKREFERLLVFLEELRSNVPSLQVVQLLNEENVECLLRTHTILAVQALRPYADATLFRVEDQEGVLLTDRLKARLDT